MKKFLPVNLDTKITTEICNFIRLAIVLSDEEYLPWYVERFIVLFLDENYFFSNYYNYGTLSARYLYDEVLLAKPLSCKINLTDQIKNNINNKKYIQILCDKYYINGSQFYNKSHFYHELLIIGYDDNSNYYFIDLNVNNMLTGIHSINEENLLKSWDSSLKNIKDKKNEDLYDLSFMQFDFPISSLELKSGGKKDSPNLNQIYYALQFCKKNIVYQNLFCGMTSINRTGPEIYKIYYDNLCQKLREDEHKNILLEYDNIILISLKRVIENKIGLYFRFKYLMEKNLIKNDTDLIKKMNELKDSLEYAFNCLTKYAYTFENELLNEAVKTFKESEKIDSENLDRCLKLTGDAIRLNYY